MTSSHASPSQPPEAAFRPGFRLNSVNTWLIWINIAVFVLDWLLLSRGIGYRVDFLPAANDQNIMGVIEYWGHFSQGLAIEQGQVWRFLGFQFLHAGFFHLFSNMIVMYFFGPMIEAYLGPRRFLAYYLLCGIAGPVAYLLMSAAGYLASPPWMPPDLAHYIPLIGASAGVFGIIIGAARVAPDVEVMLLIPPVPMKLKTLAWFLVGLAAYTVIFFGDRAGYNAGGEAAHLGGAALGYLLIRRAHLLDWAKFRFNTWRPGGGGRDDDDDDNDPQRLRKRVRKQLRDVEQRNKQ